ncbi:PLC-like phosphodiesterase [Nemania sp. NC0429]|nr:PLC-like phosphodiesterase [Nemania sp. NC0429]
MASLRASELPRDEVSMTDANVAVINDCPDDITVRVETNDNMAVKLPDTMNLSSGGTFMSQVKAGNFPWQSFFVLNFNGGNRMKIEIGRGGFKTLATPEYFQDGKAAALLAPAKPFSTGTDYYFWFFNGPGVLPPLINSAIQANLPAILAYVAKNPPTIPLFDNVSVTVKTLKIDPAQVQCVYAACLPKPGPQGTTWIFNTILRVGSAAMLGSATVKGETGGINFSVRDLMIYIQAQVDLTYDTKLHAKVRVTTLQCSLGNYDISGPIVTILMLMFPILADLLGPYRMAGAINTNFNQTIIDRINALLTPVPPVHDLAFASMFSLVSLILRPPIPTTPGLPSFPVGLDTANWMSDPRIQTKTLAQLKLPGTHDSATYNLSDVLSLIPYPDIGGLWYFSDGSAPANGQWPISTSPSAKNPDYMGKVLYKYVMGTGVNSISRTQGSNVYSQLQAGIRHFDFRVYYDPRDDTLYTQHAIRGPPFREILSQIGKFFYDRPTSSELVFAVISHTNYTDFPDMIPKLIALIKTYFGLRNNLFYPSKEKGFDFQSLASTRLTDITKGAPKVMFINPDACYFPEIITNTLGYAGTPWSTDMHTTDELAKREGTGLEDNSEPLWSVSWSLAADVPTIIATNLTLLTGVQKWVLRDLATVANKALRGFLGKYGGPNGKFNVVTVDWPELGDRETVPEMIIQMNYGVGKHPHITTGGHRRGRDGSLL